MLKSLAIDLVSTLDPTEYLIRLDYNPYPWQVAVLDAIKNGDKRIHITGARQEGKSTISAGIPAFISKSEKALTLIYAPSEDQAKDDITRVKDFIYRDDSYPKLVLDSAEHVKLPNGSFIQANTSTAKTKRGKSKPRCIILEEAAQIEDVLYKTTRPMLTENPDCIIIMISSPFGRRGFFFKASRSERWTRFVVKAPWDVVDGKLVPAEPEEKYHARLAAQGLHGFYSPRHADRDFMEEELDEHGERWFRQEYLCEFVEPEDQVFSYDDIQAAMSEEVKAMSFGLPERVDIPTLEIGK